MDRIAVFVDAGYFWVQAGQVVLGRACSREALQVDYAALRCALLAQAQAQFPEARLLRVYWYDGPAASGEKSLSHRAIDELDDFKLRLGSRNRVGEQKAVDGLIIADVIGLAQSRSIAGAILLSGDADLVPGVVAAQSLGMRVHLLSLGSPAATSPSLRAEVDCKIRWEDSVVRSFATPASGGDVATLASGASPSSSPSPSLAGPLLPQDDPFKAIAQEALSQLRQAGQAVTLNAQTLPAAVDGKLLWLARRHFGRQLDDAERRALRHAFKSLL